MRMNVLPACMYMRHIVQYYHQPEEGTESPETRVTDSREPLFGYQEWNPGSLKEQQVLFTAELCLWLWDLFL